MFSTYIKQLQYYLIRLCYIQLVISIYSFLILSRWGISFSLLSIVGNLLFNPVLVVFLCLCTLLFFTELFFIPNGYVIYLIEFLCSWWHYILMLGSTNAYNVTSAKPSLLILITAACATFMVIMHKSTYLTKIIYLLLIFGCSFWLASHIPHTNEIRAVPCAQGNLYVGRIGDECILIDPGYLGRYASASSYVEHTIIPLMAQQYSSSTIDHVILLQPGKLLFEAMIRLFEKVKINHIYIPIWHDKTPGNVRSMYMRMKAVALQKDCIIHHLTPKELTIIKSSQHCLVIRSLEQLLASSSITYRAHGILGTIDKQPFTIYPAKYTSKTLT